MSDQPTRVLVLGGSGLVGSHLVAEARNRGYEVLGTSYRQALTGLRRLDLAALEEVGALFREFRPTWVIHTAGLTWADACERDPGRAFLENAQIPASLAALCLEQGCRFVYTSSTYVFDGKDGPYAEDAEPNPINVYGRSKLEGERRVKELLGEEVLIPRLICVWGKESAEKNYAYQVLRALRSKETMLVPDKQYGNPTWAGDVASWLLALLEKRQTGIWHLAGARENCSREEWFCSLREAAISLGWAEPDARPGYRLVDAASIPQAAPRPCQAGARVDRLRAFLRYEPTDPARLDLLR